MNVIRVAKGDAKKDGSCNFCTGRNEGSVYIVSSSDPDRRSVIRFCEPCLIELHARIEETK